MGRPRKNKIQNISDEIYGEALEQDVSLEAKSLDKEDIKTGTENLKVDDGEYDIEVIVDHDGKLDPFYLSNKDPKYTYRFLRWDDKNLSKKTSNQLLNNGGWQLCTKNHLLKIGVKERFVSVDGLYRVGDTVLAFMPKELYSKKEEYNKKKADDLVKSVDQKLKHGDPNVGGREMHESMKGIQTASALGMKS